MRKLCTIDRELNFEKKLNFVSYRISLKSYLHIIVFLSTSSSDQLLDIFCRLTNLGPGATHEEGGELNAVCIRYINSVSNECSSFLLNSSQRFI